MEAKKTSRADLENKKSVFFQVGIAIALMACFAAFEWKTTNSGPIVINKPDVVFDPIDIPVTFPDKPEVKLQPSMAMEIVKDTEEQKDVVRTSETTQSAAIPEPPVFEPRPEETVVENHPINIAEEMPDFVGGYAALQRYLGSQIKYPAIDKDLGIKGTVYVKFIVEKDGSISGVELLKGVSPTIDAEAIRVVKGMPRWNPGKQRGMPVRVFFNLPIRFDLK